MPQAAAPTRFTGVLDAACGGRDGSPAGRSTGCTPDGTTRYNPLEILGEAS
jgi:hypothetical protein